eukprot:3815390-Rhodomonas_salina.2
MSLAHAHPHCQCHCHAHAHSHSLTVLTDLVHLVEEVDLLSGPRDQFVDLRARTRHQLILTLQSAHSQTHSAHSHTRDPLAGVHSHTH